MDAFLQIPHASELDFVTDSDLLSFPYRHPVNPSCPYQQVHDEVLSMMPFSRPGPYNIQPLAMYY